MHACVHADCVYFYARTGDRPLNVCMHTTLSVYLPFYAFMQHVCAYRKIDVYEKLQAPCIVSKAAPKMRASQVPCCSTYLTTQEVPGESGEGLCFQSCYYDNTNIPTGWGLVHRWIHTVHLGHVSVVQQPGFSGCDAALGHQSCPKSHIF